MTETAITPSLSVLAKALQDAVPEPHLTGDVWWQAFADRLIASGAVVDAAEILALHPAHTEKSGKVACPTCLLDYPCPTAAAVSEQREDARCSLCGDPLTDPAGCPDRHGWEDHGTCCVGTCPTCKGEVTTS